VFFGWVWPEMKNVAGDGIAGDGECHRWRGERELEKKKKKKKKKKKETRCVHEVREVRENWRRIRRRKKKKPGVLYSFYFF
jgi:hypothetical protein